jgi:hypothetical protein
MANRVLAALVDGLTELVGAALVPIHDGLVVQVETVALNNCRFGLGLTFLWILDRCGFTLGLRRQVALVFFLLANPLLTLRGWLQ